MGSQQLLMPTAQICQALAVGTSSLGQLLLTTVVCRPNVFQSGLQESPKDCGGRRLASTICMLLEGRGWGWGGATAGEGEAWLVPCQPPPPIPSEELV